MTIFRYNFYVEAKTLQIPTGGFIRPTMYHNCDALSSKFHAMAILIGATWLLRLRDHNLPATNTFHNQRESTYSKHLTNFLPTYCFYVRAASTFQHLANNIPIQNSTFMLHTNNLLQSTFPQHHPHIASIDSPQAK